MWKEEDGLLRGRGMEKRRPTSNACASRARTMSTAFTEVRSRRRLLALSHGEAPGSAYVFASCFWRLYDLAPMRAQFGSAFVLNTEPQLKTI